MLTATWVHLEEMGLATTWDVEMGLLECWREVGLWGGRGRVVSNLLSYLAYLTPKGKGQESHWKDESEFRRSVQAEGTMIFKALQLDQSARG